MTDPKRTFHEIKCDLARSLKQQAEAWHRHETATRNVPDETARASRIRRFLESVARFAESQG